MLEVRNNNNILQIDGNYQNLQFLRKVQLSSGGAYAQGFGGTYSYGYKIPIGANELVFAYAFSGSGAGTFYQEALTDDEDANKTAYSVVSVPADKLSLFNFLECYVFGVPSSPYTGARCGMEIFNNDGSLVFSSANKYLNVMAAEHLYTENKNDLSKTYSFGSRKAAVSMGIAWRDDYNNGGVFLSRESITIDNTAKTVTIGCGDVRVSDSSYYSQNLWDNRMSSYLIADVTNF